MRPGNVPTSRIGPLIAELITDRWPHGDGVEVLAEKVGCSYDAIDGIRCQQLEGCDFDLADRLLCALGRPDAWRGVLADVYLEMPLLESCALEECSVKFASRNNGSTRRRFCSAACRMSARHKRIGRTKRAVKRHRGEMRSARVCRNGHARTAENTKVRANGKRECILCARITNNRGYARRVGTELALASSQGFSE